jgi:hypothetical protein
VLLYFRTFLLLGFLLVKMHQVVSAFVIPLGCLTSQRYSDMVRAYVVGRWVTVYILYDVSCLSSIGYIFVF